MIFLSFSLVPTQLNLILETIARVVLRNQLIQVYLPKLLGSLYKYKGWLKNSKEQVIFIQELTINLHLTAVILGARIKPKESLEQAISRELANNQDVLPFVIEGVTCQYLIHYPETSLRHFFDTTEIQLACPTQGSMYHVGIGMGMGLLALEAYEKAADLRAKENIIIQFCQSCFDKSVEGYAGCVLEPLGLIAMTRGFGQTIILEWSQFLAQPCSSLSQPPTSYIAYLFHGLGRGYYFNPSNLLPSKNESLKYKAVLKVEVFIQELSQHIQAPDLRQVAIANLIAGLFWAICAVSLQQPPILMDYLCFVYNHCPKLMAHQDAIAGGICTNLLMLHLTKPLAIYSDQILTAEQNFFTGLNQSSELSHGEYRRLYQQLIIDPYSQYLSEIQASNEELRVENVFRA